MDNQKSREPVALNRRDILAGIAGSTIGIGMLSGLGAARSKPEGVELTELQPPRSARILGRIKRTEEYQRINRYVSNELGGKVRFNIKDATIVEVSNTGIPGEETTRILAYSSIEGTSGDEAYATIGIEPDSGEVLIAGTEMSTVNLVSPDEYPIEVKGTTGSDATVRTKIHMADMKEAEVRTDTVSPDDFERVRDSVSSPGEEFATQGYVCDLCKTAVNALCIAGCGAPVWFLCGFLGIASGGIGGFACGSFIAVACTLIAVYGCTTSGVDQAICSDYRLNLC